jgi:hypothetical protein
MPEGFIPPHGGYRKLLSYQRAEVVYDATVRFCERFLERRDRTVDLMVRAARSGNWSARRARTTRRSEKASSTPIQPFRPMSSSG